jgi:Family of unknown function (DUF5678)
LWAQGHGSFSSNDDRENGPHSTWISREREFANSILQWLATHAREYAGQWVALDGDRLIAHGPHHHEVWAAAEASGVYLPLVTFVENPDRVYAGF